MTWSILLAAAMSAGAQERPARLETFLAEVTAGNPRLKEAAAKRDAAMAKVMGARGAFDPVAEASFGGSKFHSSSALGSPSEARGAKASLKFPTRLGPTASLDARVARGDLKTPVKPTGRGGTIGYSIEVPLLQGALMNPASAELSKATLEAAAAEAEYRRKRLAVLLKASAAWYKLAEAKQTLAIERELLANADFRFDAVSKRSARGDLPEIAAVEAEREVWLRRERVAEAEGLVGVREAELNAFFTDGLPPPLRSAVPETSEGEPISAKTIETAEAEALNARPEIAAVRLAQEAARVDARLARNSILPRLDALWSQGQDRGDGGIGGAYRWGVELKVPLLFRKGRAGIRRTRLSLKALDWNRRSLGAEIRAEVRGTVAVVNADAQRLQAARKAVELAQRLAAAERTAFRLGDSTLFLVNRRERAEASARVKAAKILAEYRISRAAFEAARGALGRQIPNG